MTSRGTFNVRWSFVVVVVIVVVCSLGTKTAGSAIPVWEFLTRGEKMSRIYDVFSEQVARHCSNQQLPKCNKNFLLIGLKRLSNIDDNDLERLDPYDRDAETTIWRAMTGEKRLTTSKFGREDIYYSGNDLANTDSVNNRLEDEGWAPVDYYARTSSQLDGPHLVGPMVIRVFPDGRPVPEDAQRPLPRDDDLDQLKYPKIPSLLEIETSGKRFFYKKPTYHSRPASKRNTISTHRKQPATSTVQRPARISTINYSHYRRVNPLFGERRVSADEISVNTRPIRTY